MDDKDINKDIRAKVQKILDEMINPAVAGHGGWVDLLDVKENMVYLRLGGGCQGCGMVNVTLKQGIEATLREGGKAVASARAHRATAEPFGGTCGQLRKVARAIASDLAAWLAAPTSDAALGDAR